jgi:UDP-2,3-diacylglucosamine hydrolase
VNYWFVSDLHLNDVFERNGVTLLRFLFELNKNPQKHQLFLVGDIFDVWVSDGSVFVNKFQLIIDELVKLKKGGGKVFYFEGNHDVHIDKFWTKKFGIEVYDEPHTFNLNGLKVKVEHGDYINPDDAAYLKYLSIIKHPFVEFLGHVLPSYFWSYIANKQSKKSRKKTSRYAVDNAENLKKLIRAHAERSHSQENFDLIVTGHMHVFDDYQFLKNNKSVRSINLGTWLDKPRALKISENKIEVIELG